MKKIFYAGEPGDGFGWGVCSANLIRALGKLEGVKLMDEVDEDTIVFMPIADHGLRPSGTQRGWKTVGYTFFEYPLEDCAAENAKQYDLIFAGSTWCQERLAERGIKSVVLVQGVDHEIFKPGPGRPADGEFWIFSGGKFEYRKGQDLVLAAFKEIAKTHPKAKLITAWRNNWVQCVDTMAESPHIKYELKGGTWSEQLGHLCTINGIPKERVMTLPGIVHNRDMPDIYRQCDLGLFPNRCEGGTNLVMMEFMACGRPVVATKATGHRDIWCTGMVPMDGSLNPYSHWFSATPEEIAEVVSAIMNHPSELPWAGERAAEAMKTFTWERAARTIIENV